MLRRMCLSFRSAVPGHLAAIRDALTDADAPRLREAAHRFAGMLAAFSTAAGAMASDLEKKAAGGRLEECRPLVDHLEATARELLRQVDGLSIDALLGQPAAAGART